MKLVSVLLLVALAQTHERPRLSPTGLYRGSARLMAPPYALFEFAPASGAGMGAACACTTPTGAKGEVMTFTRASTGWCTKGNETTGIANGDLVECASGQPRVMPGGDGTGGLGLSVWEARTNYALRSQEIDNAVWTKSAFGPAAPTVTANYADGPCGTPSASCGAAERVEIPATAAAEYSYVNTTGATSNIQYSACLYVKGNGTSGTTDFALYDGLTWVGNVQDLAFNATTWVRATKENVLIGSFVSAQIAFGNLSTMNGGVARSAVDILVWQGDLQPGGTCGPPITTAGTAATRVAELADVALSYTDANGYYSGSSYIAGKVQSGSTAPMGVIGNGTVGVDVGSANGSYPYHCGGGSFYCLDVSPVFPNGYTNVASISPTPSATEYRTHAYFDGTELNGCVSGICGAGQAGVWTAPAWTRWRIGNYTTTSGSINGVQKKMCLDTYASGNCRQ